MHNRRQLELFSKLEHTDRRFQVHSMQSIMAMEKIWARPVQRTCSWFSSLVIDWNAMFCTKDFLQATCEIICCLIPGLYCKEDFLFSQVAIYTKKNDKQLCLYDGRKCCQGLVICTESQKDVERQWIAYRGSAGTVQTWLILHVNRATRNMIYKENCIYTLD